MSLSDLYDPQTVTDALREADVNIDDDQESILLALRSNALRDPKLLKKILPDVINNLSYDAHFCARIAESLAVVFQVAKKTQTGAIDLDASQYQTFSGAADRIASALAVSVYQQTGKEMDFEIDQWVEDAKRYQDDMQEIRL